MFVMHSLPGEKAGCLCLLRYRARPEFDDNAPDILGMQWGSKKRGRSAKKQSLSIC
jgi:hypothetical protein